jgi:hypothetical protein
MSRLRNVQGVTRVSLSKSAKTTVETGQPGDPSAVGPCGKGSPPSFELVVFFEKATVGAALADVTGAPSTGAAAPAPAADGKAAATATPTATPGG